MRNRGRKVVLSNRNLPTEISDETPVEACQRDRNICHRGSTLVQRDKTAVNEPEHLVIEEVQPINDGRTRVQRDKIVVNEQEHLSSRKWSRSTSAVHVFSDDKQLSESSHSPGEMQSAGFQPPTLHEGHSSEIRKPFGVSAGPRSTSKFLKQLNATCRISKIQQDAHK